MYSVDIDVTSSSCVRTTEPLLMWHLNTGMNKQFPKNVIPTAFVTLSIVLDSMTFNPRNLNIITFRNMYRCFYMQSLSYPNRKHATYDILFHRGDM